MPRLPKRPSKGRQKIELKKIEDEGDRYATFSKRKHGIFKSVTELITSCKANVGVIIFSPKNKPHSFFHPNMEKVVDRFLNGNESVVSNVDRAADEMFQERDMAMNLKLDQLDVDEEIQKARSKQLDEMNIPYDDKDLFGKHINEMDAQNCGFLKSSMLNFIAQLNN
ncbi:OLC1v1005625C1 [Oldenlandia corymbosa var. corymbosa]|uniref:OLC1v1005625C1 n=1 Tax=Oldenlandia corymbosa var. corymbosa TaxID=529605 RepID=A0AAV1DHH7_OLDCO|nr:OLC1v1005625C1 [Oldenlandia corymbosa var. corymbosa]